MKTNVKVILLTILSFLMVIVSIFSHIYCAHYTHIDNFPLYGAELTSDIAQDYFFENWELPGDSVITRNSYLKKVDEPAVGSMQIIIKETYLEVAKAEIEHFFSKNLLTEYKGNIDLPSWWDSSKEIYSNCGVFPSQDNKTEDITQRIATASISEYNEDYYQLNIAITCNTRG